MIFSSDFRLFTFLFFLFSGLLLLTSNRASGQELYHSISGENVEVASGDTRNMYEFWLLPQDSSATGTLQIFDAGLGGPFDLITQEDASTKTNYKLFPFSEHYRYEEGNLTSVDTSGTALETLSTFDEIRFQNRWTKVATLSAEKAGRGYLLRASTLGGDDTNSFKIRVVNEEGEVLTGSSWKLISIDLSVALFKTTPEIHFQLQPYPGSGQLPINTAIQVEGEEDSEVIKLDAFGNSSPVETDEPAFPEHLYGLDNSWGVRIQGSSKEWLNNLTVYGAEQPVLWEFEPVLQQQTERPDFTLSSSLGEKCSSYQFNLGSTDIHREVLRETRWLLGNDIVAEGENPVISFPQTGNADITALVPNEANYFPRYWILNESIFINTPPDADIQASQLLAAPGEPVQLSGEKSSDPDNASLSYNWSVNGELRSRDQDFVFNNSVPGLYNISLTVNDGGSNIECSEDTDSVVVRINTQPYAEISYTPLFGTEEAVTFNATEVTDADNDSLDFRWEGPGIVEPPAVGPEVTVQHTTPGEYPIELVADDGTNTSNATYSTSAIYEINAAPTPAFTMPDQAAPDQNVTLDASSSSDPNEDPLSYQWFINGQPLDNGVQAITSFEHPGKYKVTLEVDDNRKVSNSVQQSSKTIHINAAPEPEIAAESHSTSALQTFSAENSGDQDDQIVSYEWELGDGSTATGETVRHLYPEAGIYDVKLTVNDGQEQINSVQTARHTLRINRYPEAAFSLPRVVGPGQTFTLDGTESSDPDGKIRDYEWYLDGEMISTERKTELELEEPGEHVITHRVRDDSGFEDAVGTISRKIRVNRPPVPEWSVDQGQLEPDREIEFSALSSSDPDGEISTYRWTFQDGQTLEGATVARSFSESGPQEFTLAVADNDSVNNSEQSVEGEINLNHQPFIVTDKNIRTNNLSVTLDASSSYDLDEDELSFTWTLPDGSKRRSATFTWNPPAAGVHFVGLTIDDGKGLTNSQNEESVQVLVNRPVQASVDSVIQSCTGQTILFNSSDSYDPEGDPFSARWNFGDGTTSEEANPSHVYSEPGVYETEVQLSDGFSDEPTVAKIPVIIEGSPVAKMNIPDTTVCVNTPIRIDGSQSTDPSGSLSSYNWDFGDGNTASGPKINHLFTEPGEYVVSLTVTGSGSGRCSNVSQITRTVQVVSGPVANFDTPEWIAPDEELTLDASESESEQGIETARWLISNADDGTAIDTLGGMQNSYSFPKPGDYDITLLLITNSGTSCNRVSKTRTVKVNETPKIEWDLPEAVAVGHNLLLDGTGAADSDGFIQRIQWFADGEQVGTNATEHIKLTDPGEHQIRLAVTDNAVAENKTTTVDKTIFANAPPVPSFTLPDTVFQNQTLTLSPRSTTDADGDKLQTNWKLNGNLLDTPRITLSDAGIYKVTLLQDDGRGLPNSIDSTITTFKPVRVPEIDPDLPNKIVIGEPLSISEIDPSSDIFFVQNGSPSESWSSSNTGRDTLVLGWKPEDDILYREQFGVSVVKALQFETSRISKTVQWNPANPSVMLEAPQTNRSEEESVSFTWKQNGSIIGYGSTIQVAVQQGENRFTVEVTDKETYPSKTVTAEVFVTADSSLQATTDK